MQSCVQLDTNGRMILSSFACGDGTVGRAGLFTEKGKVNDRKWMTSILSNGMTIYSMVFVRVVDNADVPDNQIEGCVAVL